VRFRWLAPYTVYENDRAFPRAFVVPGAKKMPPAEEILPTFRQADFEAVVYLDELEAESVVPNGHFSAAEVKGYFPNRVEIESANPAGGWLVLMDVWHPGWTAEVDGQPAKLYRANHTFRAVQLPPGTHQVTFRFSPKSFRMGRIISLSTCALIALLCFVRWLVVLKTPSVRG
jgi:hypothetical protein